MASLPSTLSPEKYPIVHDDSDEYGSEIDVPTAAAAESDYGSDWDSVTVDHLTKSESSSLLPEIVIIENELIPDEPEAQTHSLRLARVPSSQDHGVEANGLLASPARRAQRMPSVEVEYDEGNRTSFTC